MNPNKPDDRRNGHPSDELAGVYRAAAHEVPRPGLDAKILDAARQAGATPPAAGRPFRRWLVPLSLAATVLLSVGAVLRFGALDREESRPAALSAPAEMRREAQAPPAAETFARERSAKAGAPAGTRQGVIAGAADAQRRHGAATSDAADVISVDTAGEPGAYEFKVGIRSADAGCGRYADWWEVVSEDGRLLYRRVLLHSHVDEQPFVRAGGPVPIDSATVVWIRAHMSDGGYGGTAFKGSVESGFAPAPLSPGFASRLAQQPPLPDSCAF